MRLFIIFLVFLVSNAFSFTLETYLPEKTSFSFITNGDFLKGVYTINRKYFKDYDSGEVLAEVFKNITTKEISNIKEFAISSVFIKDNTQEIGLILIDVKDSKYFFKSLKKYKLLKKRHRDDFSIEIKKGNKVVEFYGKNIKNMFFLVYPDKKALKDYISLLGKIRKNNILKNKLYISAKKDISSSENFGFFNPLNKKNKELPFDYIAFSSYTLKSMLKFRFISRLKLNKFNPEKGGIALRILSTLSKSNMDTRLRFPAGVLAMLSLGLDLNKLEVSDEFIKILDMEFGLSYKEDVIPIFDRDFIFAIYPPSGSKYPDIMMGISIKNSELFKRLLDTIELKLVRYGILLSDDTYLGNRVKVINLPFFSDIKPVLLMVGNYLYISSTPLLLDTILDKNKINISKTDYTFKYNPDFFIELFLNFKAITEFIKSYNNTSISSIKRLENTKQAKNLRIFITDIDNKNKISGELDISLPKINENSKK